MASTLDINSIATNTILQKFVIDSNEALALKLVRTASDLEDDQVTFRPDMSHQIYGDSEQIFGYSGLKIKLYYTACRLMTYLAHSYDETVDPSEFEGVKPDDVIKPIAEKIPPGYLTNIDDFTRALDKDQNFKPFGEMVHRFTVETTNGEEKVFEVYFNDISPSGFLSFYERLQTFILWYIDASSYIDTDDARWKFFLIYEKFMESGKAHHAFVGCTTVYEYYAFPANIRPRISQMFILPPFQRLGLGAEMLQTIYKQYKGTSKVIDITVEDPAENFQRLRDFVDCKNCLKIKCFSADSKLNDLTKEMIEEVHANLKLNKKQIRRVFEILKFQRVDKENQKQYKNYRLLVKNRLYALYRKEDNDLKKLKKVLSADELAAALSITSKEQRLETLEKLYKELEEEYEHIVEKLETIDLSF